MGGELIELLEKRIATLDYLVKVHDGTASWMNSVRVSKNDLANLYSAGNNKSYLSTPYSNFYLGCSLSLINSRYGNLQALIKALTGVMKEYESVNGHSSDSLSTKKVVAAGRKFFRQRKESLGNSGISLRRRSASSTPNNAAGDKSSTINGSTSSLISSPLGGVTPSGSNGSSTSLNGYNIPTNTPMPFDLESHSDLQYLIIHHLPFVPDVYQTFVSLLETLSSSYRVVLHLVELGHLTPASMNEAYDSFIKFDNRVNKLLITPTVKELDDLSKTLAYDDITKLNTLLVKA